MADPTLHTTPEGSSSPSDAHSSGARAPLQGRIASFPHLPGVYLFRGSDRSILYVGKARDLRKRIASYFKSSGDPNVKNRVLLARAADLEYVVTSTEKEALLLESSLIKQHRPRYNVVLRDDKTYPSLRIDPREPFPRLDMVRRYQRDGALYFGPYPSGNAVRENLRLLNQLFPLRLCKGKKLVPRDRPCLNHSLGRCLGACAGKVTAEDYARVVEELVLFLQGKNDLLEKELQKRMEESAANLEFERAAFYRDRIRTLRSMLEKQTVVSEKSLNQDVIGIHREGDVTELALLFVRKGVLMGQRSFDLSDVQGDLDDLATSFIQQYYTEGRYIPEEVVVPMGLESGTVLEERLAELKGRRVRLIVAQRGDRRQLLELARKNARERQASRGRKRERDEAILHSLQRILRLPRLPHRMACIDISNIQGQHAVGGLVVFTAGKPDKEWYRHYRIEEKSEPDDPAMMTEVVRRLVRNDPEFFRSLDLLMLDGGKGQLNTVLQVLKEERVDHLVPLISIAKEREADRGEAGRGLYEKIYIPGRKNPLFLSRFPDILHLLQRLRDETHRFAISHYQSLHRAELVSSVLDRIPGVGSKRRQLLLQHFPSIDSLRAAEAEAIQQVPGISRGLALRIVELLSEEALPAGEDPGDDENHA
ncbi:MAG: excinuclease ABC subunit UvrC [Syntrophobacteraceae bacterium]|jgi:excinuclease ABC subunit C|nr:excinuclease ABC subunit UvrC [Syntrophobacteraceae bacterium]